MATKIFLLQCRTSKPIVLDDYVFHFRTVADVYLYVFGGKADALKVVFLKGILWMVRVRGWFRGYRAIFVMVDNTHLLHYDSESK